MGHRPRLSVRSMKETAHWHREALAAYERGAGLASTAVRLDVDLRMILHYLVEVHGKADLRELYPGYFQERGGEKDRGHYGANATHRRDRDRPRRRGSSAAIIGPDGRVYGD